MKSFLTVVVILALHLGVLFVGAGASASPTVNSEAGSLGTAQGFVHPGGLHTQADLDRMKEQVAAQAHPWIDGWNQLITDSRAQNTYQAHPQDHMGSRQTAQNDASAAYLNAIRWYISGDTSYADCAVRNLNSWAATVNHVPYGTDQPGLSGIPIGTFALAAEVLRIYPGWKQRDQDAFKHMLLTYFYPSCNDFLTHQTGNRYWANWHTANILAVIAIGVFCDDQKIFDQGVDDFKNGSATGSIMNAVNNLYPGGLGQWQESGRDQAHAFGGQGLLAEACQVAWNQNIDLFGYANNRLLAGAEYNAQYTQWKGVPYTFYTNEDNANEYYISSNYHGRLGNCEYFELLYNHYVVLKGLKAPNVKRFAELLRPEGGNVDILGYGTLTYTLKPEASPYPASPIPPVPMDLSTVAGLGRVDLKWSPSGAYSTRGYNVLRATTSGGPYENLFTTSSNTSPRFTDTKVTNGTTYYYVVSAINQAGTSANSTEASATPVAGETLPQGWLEGDVGSPGRGGNVTYANAANNSFVISGSGAFGGEKDNCHLVYQSVSGDFTITARLISMNGTVDKVGLMLRENLNEDSKTFAMTVGELGWRQGRSRARTDVGTDMLVQFGCDYSWLPVWFRLQRSGNTFTSSQSGDGISWFTTGTRDFPMASNYLVGLVATSGQTNGKVATGTFDNVTTDVAPPNAPDAPSKLATKSLDSGSIKLTWINNAKNQTGFKIECSTDQANFYEIADLASDAASFVNTGLTPGTNYSYRVRAYNIGGYSDYSNTTSSSFNASSGSTRN